VIDRRAFLALACAGFSSPRVSAAQSPATSARIGLVSPFSPSDAASWHDAFRLGLRELGWTEGTNIRIDYRYAHGRDERLPALIAELARLNVQIIVTSVTEDALVAKKVTTTIPIVMAAAGDPVATGIVDSLARPGGNLTGLSQMAPELVGKRLGLLKEIVPRLARVGVIWVPGHRASASNWREIQGPARELGVQLHSLEVQNADQFERAFADAARAKDEAVVITPNPIFVTSLKRLADLAIKHRLPSIFHLSEFVKRADSWRTASIARTSSGAPPSTWTGS